MRFKKPKMFVNEGSEDARMRRHAEQIQNQQQLDLILSQVDDPKIAEAWLDRYGRFMKFKPKTDIPYPD